MDDTDYIKYNSESLDDEYSPNYFRTVGELIKFDREFDNTVSEFFDVKDSVEKKYKSNPQKISDIIELANLYEHQMRKYSGSVGNKTAFLIAMRKMINKYTDKDPRLIFRDKILSSDKKGKFTSHSKIPVMDIWDVDNETIERDEKRLRKKKPSIKLKRKVIRKSKSKCKISKSNKNK